MMKSPSVSSRPAGNVQAGDANVRKRPSTVANAFWSMLILNAVLSLVVIELLNSLNPDVWIPPVNLVLCVALILLLELVLLGILKKMSWAMAITQVLLTVLALVNYFKQYFRGDPLFAGDAVMAGTADKIMTDLRYSLELRLSLAILVLLAAIVLASRSRRRIARPFHRLLLTASAAFLLILLVTGVFWNATARHDWLKMSDYPWNALAGTRENGFLIPFVRSMEDLLPAKQPQQSVPNTDYQVAAPVTKASPDKPNVIILMSEAFSDLEHIKSLKTSEPIMPYYRSLQKQPNTIEGSLLVSIFGGSTSSTEFEFLTGSSMYFVNDGLVPYMKWFDKPTHSLADLFNQQGYRSIAIHPFYRTYYDRHLVLPAMGFSAYIAMEQFPVNVQKVHGNISDQEHVNQIIRTFEQKAAAERLFLFTVSMQNHFPYDNAEAGLAELPYHVRLPEMQNASSAELYLSLLRTSDDALKSLIGYFEKVQEPTMIVVFGDHLPGLSSGFRPFYQQFLGKRFEELDLLETQKMYETPFLIWANYPLPDDHVTLISPNFLSAKVAALAKADLSPYYQYLISLNRDITAISNKILVLKNGNTADRDHVPAELIDQLGKYWRYQYDNITRSLG